MGSRPSPFSGGAMAHHHNPAELPWGTAVAIGAAILTVWLACVSLL